MKINKLVFLLCLTILISTLTMIHGKAFKRLITTYDHFPTYPIYPNQETLVRVNQQQLTLSINNEHADQKALITYRYTLENTSQTEETLPFILPIYEMENVQVIEQDHELDYQITKWLYFTGRHYDFMNYDEVNYPRIVNALNEILVNPELENKLVKVYHIEQADKNLNLEINYTDQSSVISNFNFYHNNEEENKITHTNYLYKDIYMIDIYNDLDVKLSDQILQPIKTVTFKEAVYDYIEFILEKEFDEKTLYAYLQAVMNSEYTNTGFNYLYDYHFNDVFTVNQYELVFQPNEIKEITVTYTINPTKNLTKTDHYYTYNIIVNQENWLSAEQLMLKVNLNETYKYIHESSIDFIDLYNNSYQYSVDNDQTRLITFSLFTTEDAPEFITGNFGTGLAILILIIGFFYGLPFVLVGLLILSAIIIAIRSSRSNHKIKYKKF